MYYLLQNSNVLCFLYKFPSSILYMPQTSIYPSYRVKIQWRQSVLMTRFHRNLHTKSEHTCTHSWVCLIYYSTLVLLFCSLWDTHMTGSRMKTSSKGVEGACPCFQCQSKSKLLDGKNHNIKILLREHSILSSILSSAVRCSLGSFVSQEEKRSP